MGRSKGSRSKRRDPTSAKPPRPAWEVRPSPLHGRGVFATRDIDVDEEIHVAPVLLFSDDEWEHLAETLLVDYVFEWHAGGVALALGVGSIFNHATHPNVRYELCDDAHPAAPAHSYVADRAIRAGDELTIDYGSEYTEWRGWD